MQTKIPFIESVFQKLSIPDLPNLLPPEWAIHETQRRIVLLMNHVLMQDSEATQRLTLQQGRVTQVRWRTFSFKLLITPAGLLDLADQISRPDLVLTVLDESPLVLAQTAFHGDKPALHIEGDVHLASEVNWLIGHVRWDIEKDLANIIGDVPAHTLSQSAQGLSAALRQFIARAASFVSGKGST